MQRFLLATLVVGLTLACTDDPVAPDVAPTLDIVNAPPFSGIVFRGEGGVAWTWADTKTGLRVSVGFDPVAICNGEFEFEFVPFQAVQLPTGRLGVREAGTVQAKVWGFTAFDCGRFTTEQPLASGEASYRSTDNDFFVDGPNNLNAWGLMVNGTLERPGGGTAQLAAHARIVVGVGGLSLTVNLH